MPGILFPKTVSGTCLARGPKPFGFITMADSFTFFSTTKFFFSSRACARLMMIFYFILFASKSDAKFMQMHCKCIKWLIVNGDFFEAKMNAMTSRYTGQHFHKRKEMEKKII